MCRSAVVKLCRLAAHFWTYLAYLHIQMMVRDRDLRSKLQMVNGTDHCLPLQH